MTDDILKRECKVAMTYDCASVCIKPYAVRIAVDLLSRTGVKVGTVIGFPHGNSTTVVKVAETERACADGAVEIDMVVNIGKALGGDWEYVKEEIQAINEATVKNNSILKVIFENDFMQEEQIIKLCEICSELDVAFVKTSSGYGFIKQENGMYSYKGATAPHLKLMRKHSKPSVEVKAAGGVKSLKDLLYVRSLGVTRVGATATAKMLDDAQKVIDEGGKLEDLIPSDAGNHK